jgi:hypothetical protein
LSAITPNKSSVSYCGLFCIFLCSVPNLEGLYDLPTIDLIPGNIISTFPDVIVLANVSVLYTNALHNFDLVAHGLDTISLIHEYGSKNIGFVIVNFPYTSVFIDGLIHFSSNTDIRMVLTRFVNHFNNKTPSGEPSGEAPGGGGNSPEGDSGGPSGSGSSGGPSGSGSGGRPSGNSEGSGGSGEPSGGNGGPSGENGGPSGENSGTPEENGGPSGENSRAPIGNEKKKAIKNPNRYTRAKREIDANKLDSRIDVALAELESNGERRRELYQS